MESRFTARELDIMRVLWEHGPSTVAEVREALHDELAYNTVLTMLRLMEEKGQVERTQEGRAHRYAPVAERAAVGRSALRQIAERLFDGSREALLLGLVDQGDLTDDELRRMRDLLAERIDKGADE